MGNQLTMGVDINPSDILEGLKTKAPLGNGKGRLLKSLHCSSEDGDVVCKMYLKTEGQDDLMLDNHARVLKRCDDDLREHGRSRGGRQGNVCFYTLYKNIPCTKTEMKAAFVVRTYFRHSLQDRIMTRPFLTRDNKLWLSYQLLRAVQETHAAHVPHGDLKVSNVMVTSLGWLYITDLAPFKPSHIRPADFSYFFDTAENRHCNLAPERFLSDDEGHLLTEKITEPVTEKMDSFGVGCAIAQLFLGGAVLFKLDQLLAYKNGTYDPAARLHEKIEDPPVVELVLALINKDVSKRPTATEALNQFTPSVFPEFFKTLHEDIIGPLVSLSPDKRVAALYPRIPEIIGMLKDNPNYLRTCLVNIATVLCGTIRHCLITQNRVACLEAMIDMAPYVGDDCNLQTLLPYAVTMCKDKQSPLVRVTAVKMIAKTTENISLFPPSEANLFDDYIIPAITPLASDKSVLVKAGLAERLPAVAIHARRFLETRQLLPTVESTQSGRMGLPYNEGYDADLCRIQDLFQEIVVTLVLAPNVTPWVTRGFLADITKLCVFFGRQRTNNFIIPTLTISTLFLNAPDFQVRKDLHKQLVGIALYVGPTFLSYILPLMKEGLLDVEEIVAHEALSSLAKLSRLGFFDRRALVDLCEVVVPLLIHPSKWIRNRTIEFFATMEGAISEVDVICFIMPLISPFLKFAVPCLSVDILQTSLIQPISRAAFEEAIKRGSVGAVVDAMQGTPSNSRTASPLSRRSSDTNESEQSGIPRNQSGPFSTGNTGSEHIKLQLVQKYIEGLVKGTNRYKDRENDAPPNPVDRSKQHLFSHSNTNVLPALLDLEFNINEVDKQATKGEPGSLNLFKTVPTQRQRKRMELKAVALERREQHQQQQHQDPQQQASRREAHAAAPASGYNIIRYSRPTQNLICQTEEHTATVTDISVHGSNPSWFLTASIDETVRLWNIESLERNAALISETCYSDTTSRHGQQSSPVLSVSMLAEAQGVCGTALGSLSFFCLKSGIILNGMNLADGESSAVSTIQRLNSNDTVIAGTHRGFICGVDPRMKTEAFTMRANQEHGPISSLVVGDENGSESWVVSSTLNGHITLWDLRFRLAVRTWNLGEPVYKLALNGPEPVILIATSEIQRWSLEHLRQVASYRTCGHERRRLEERVTDTTPLESVASTSYVDTKGDSIRTICGRRDATWFATGGTDKMVRYWDTNDVTKSFVVSGLEPGQPPMKYTSSSVNEITEVREIPGGDTVPTSQPGLRPVPSQHKDAVTAMSLLPPIQGSCTVPILISASRDGCVKLWQSTSTKTPDRSH
eukprot:TRINITY_DN899_c5_g1_i1.p1 TRINITY_DN899_c5_g1~~TRINITY_DN899_c5_g1_i1.p1  ORF type:complete len:1326 (+),score=274.03 TRINITY_DN899_c5_g1_i1:61-3978(+)